MKPKQHVGKIGPLVSLYVANLELAFGHVVCRPRASYGLGSSPDNCTGVIEEQGSRHRKLNVMVIALEQLLSHDALERRYLV